MEHEYTQLNTMINYAISDIGPKKIIARREFNPEGYYQTFTNTQSQRVLSMCQSPNRISGGLYYLTFGLVTDLGMIMPQENSKLIELLTNLNNNEEPRAIDLPAEALTPIGDNEKYGIWKGKIQTYGPEKRSRDYMHFELGGFDKGNPKTKSIGTPEVDLQEALEYWKGEK